MLRVLAAPGRACKALLKNIIVLREDEDEATLASGPHGVARRGGAPALSLFLSA